MVAGCNCDIKGSDSLRRKVWDMASNTSMHGLPKVAKSSMHFRRIVWSIIFLAHCGLFTSLTVSLVLKFFSRPTSTTVEVKYSSALPFPAVTFCNINPVRKGALGRNQRMRDMLVREGERFYNMEMESTQLRKSRERRSTSRRRNRPAQQLRSETTPMDYEDVYESYQNTTSINNKDGYNGDQKNLSMDYEDGDESDTNGTFDGWNDYEDDPRYFEDLADEVRVEFDFQNEYMNLNDSERRDMGHSLRAMLLSCTFSGYRCGRMNFSHSINFRYGNCFTFNAATKTPEHVVHRTGPTYGLTLEIYIEQYREYIRETSDSAGIMLLIHNQSTMPFPEDTGFSISPGTKTVFAVSTREIQRTEPPYGDCHTYSDEENALQNVYADVENLKINYSVKACSKTCVQKQLISKCQCCSFQYKCDGAAIEDLKKEYGGRIPVCNFTNARQERCVRDVFQSFQENTLSCLNECLQPCSETSYNVDISSSKWPSKPHMEMVQDRIKRNSKAMKRDFDYMTEDERYVFVEDNVLKIQVFFKSLNYERITTEPAYTENSLLSDIGGQMGLWLGLSVVTLFEFMELLTDVVAILICRLRGQGQIRSATIVKKKLQKQLSKSMESIDMDHRSASLFDLEGGKV